jgi:nucleoside 2-deoxyribosyltransferase
MRKPIAYVASPLGFSDAGVLFHDTMLLPLIDEIGFEIRNPWALTPEELINSVQALPYGQERKEAWEKINPVIGNNNREAIEESDLIIAVLDGPDVDSGTAAEIGYGSGLKKPVFGYRGDFRPGGENEGSIVNLQVEFFVRLNGGGIVTDLESLKAVLTEYKKRFSEKLA